jgi:hypothetical protein
LRGLKQLSLISDLITNSSLDNDDAVAVVLGCILTETDWIVEI